MSAATTTGATQALSSVGLNGMVTPKATDDARIAARCRRVATHCGLVVGCLGAFTLLGWTVSLGVFGRAGSYFTLAPSVSVGFLLFGLALFFVVRAPSRVAARTYAFA